MKVASSFLRLTLRTGSRRESSVLPAAELPGFPLCTAIRFRGLLPFRKFVFT